MSPDVPCHFCGEQVDPAGVRNHETWCNENPNEGVPLKRQRELGILEDVDEPADVDREDVDESADVDLPPRESPRSRAASGPGECEGCGSGNTMPAHKARKRFREELGAMPDELRTIFDAAECYCNECWSVSGGEFDECWSLQEGLANV